MDSDTKIALSVGFTIVVLVLGIASIAEYADFVRKNQYLFCLDNISALAGAHSESICERILE